MTSSDNAHWQCDRNLQQCLKYMFKEKIACDVKFIVGEERKEVSAHRFMLISRSPVFYAMLEGPLAEKGIVEIPDVEHDVFEEFLIYLYTDEITVTSKNAVAIMYTAKKYCVDQLARKCAEFLRENITPENACTIMETCHRFSENELFQKCIEAVEKNAEACLKSDGFQCLCKDCIFKITELDNINVREDVLYEHLIKWAEQECLRQNKAATWENKREVLGDVVYNISFPSMDRMYFSENVSNIPLLTPEERIQIYRYFDLKDKCSPLSFKLTRRFMHKAETICRFREPAPRQEGLWTLNGQIDALSFQTSADSRLHGILVYGCLSGSCTYDVDVTIKDIRNNSLISHNTKLRSESETEMHEIYFGETLFIKANEEYTVLLKLMGDRSKHGENGWTNLQYGDGKTLTVLFSPLSTNSTTDKTGQIPGFILS